MSAEEQVAAASLGTEIRRLRELAEVGQREMARLIGVSYKTIWRIETGRRRTRRSTLESMAGWLIPFAEWQFDDGPSDDQEAALVDELVRIAGPALAPERKWKR